MAEATPVMQIPPLDNTFGAAFVGMTLYYYTHQADEWPTKLLVGAVMLFDTIHQALITHTVYTYVITNWGKPEILGKIIEVLFNGLTALLVQSFLTMRVWKLSNKSIILTGLISLFVIGEFVFTAIALGFETFLELKKARSQYISSLYAPALSRTVNALAAAGDVVIAVALCVILHRSRTGFHRSDSMINRLIVFAVNTGVLTSLCAVASLISISVSGDTFIYIGFFFCIGRLYTNSLLATLNARKMIRGASDPVHTTSDFSFSLRDLPKNGAAASVPGKKSAQNISIKIDTTQEFATDQDSERGDDKMREAVSAFPPFTKG
ncbi:hypothetical protein FA13DRAFT_1740710 [Coprinellus micaceus]|uniref:DUF6534 domain-containing protein n=1 Tax=Coprinellus micaceus TaxID=71717 RepID=A0A4Y7SLC3_COPMI|nr:hypothetical protein FA13DRAFT_1740710 [Coprinellus micaceus]